MSGHLPLKYKGKRPLCLFLTVKFRILPFFIMHVNKTNNNIYPCFKILYPFFSKPQFSLPLFVAFIPRQTVGCPRVFNSCKSHKIASGLEGPENFLSNLKFLLVLRGNLWYNILKFQEGFVYVYQH